MRNAAVATAKMNSAMITGSASSRSIESSARGGGGGAKKDQQENSQKE